MEKVSIFLDNLSEKHKHLYQILIGLIGATIFTILSSILYFLYANIYGIVNFIVGSSTYLLDGLYKSIAKGNGILAQVNLILAFVASFYFGIFFLLLMKIRERSINKENLKTKPITRLTIIKIKFIVYFSLTYLFILLNISIYKGTVTTLFYQNLTIITPYISEHDVTILKSRFAMMTTKNEFEIIMKEIKNIGLNNHVKTVDVPSYPF